MIFGMDIYRLTFHIPCSYVNDLTACIQNRTNIYINRGADLGSRAHSIPKYRNHFTKPGLHTYGMFAYYTRGYPKTQMQ